jgi:hypothetical protein
MGWSMCYHSLPLYPPPSPLPPPTFPAGTQPVNPQANLTYSTAKTNLIPYDSSFRLPSTAVVKGHQSRAWIFQSRIQSRIAPEHYPPKIRCILPMGTLTGRRICFFTHMSSYRHGARGMRYMIFSHPTQDKLVDVRQRGLSCHVAIATAAAPRSCSSICVVGARRPLPLALPHA